MFGLFTPRRLGELLPPRVAIRGRLEESFRRRPELGPVWPQGSLTLDQIVALENVPYESAFRGAHVGKIDAATVRLVSLNIHAAATATGLQAWYLAACLDRESRFDPGAYNENLTLVNRTPTCGGTDHGIAEWSGKWKTPKGVDCNIYKANFYNPVWAIKEFGIEMAGLVAWAQEQLAGPGGPVLVNEIGAVASNPIYTWAQYRALYLATYAYNSGTDPVKGALGDLKGPHLRIGHPNAVMSTAVEFEKELRATS